MSGRYGKHKQKYVNCPSERSKLTCLIYVPGHSSEWFKFLSNFVTKYSRGVTQGDPLSPTLFNVVVEAVVRHWLEGLRKDNDTREAEGGEGHFSAVFYADDGMVGATDPQWLQGAFSALVAIFDRVGLRTNVDKTVSMAFCSIPDSCYINRVAPY